MGHEIPCSCDICISKPADWIRPACEGECTRNITYQTVPYIHHQRASICAIICCFTGKHKWLGQPQSFVFSKAMSITHFQRHSVFSAPSYGRNQKAADMLLVQYLKHAPCSKWQSLLFKSVLRLRYCTSPFVKIKAQVQRAEALPLRTWTKSPTWNERAKPLPYFIVSRALASCCWAMSMETSWGVRMTPAAAKGLMRQLWWRVCHSQHYFWRRQDWKGPKRYSLLVALVPQSSSCSSSCYRPSGCDKNQSPSVLILYFPDPLSLLIEQIELLQEKYYTWELE